MAVAHLRVVLRHRTQRHETARLQRERRADFLRARGAVRPRAARLRYRHLPFLLAGIEYPLRIEMPGRVGVAKDPRIVAARRTVGFVFVAVEIFVRVKQVETNGTRQQDDSRRSQRDQLAHE
jgi:hypothetical protein